MAGPNGAPNGVLKRKRKDENENAGKDVNGTKSRKAPKTISKSDGTQADVLLLEEQILDSREHYNNIIVLHAILENVEKKPKTATLAAVALCRVFCRLIAREQFVKHKNDTEADAQVVLWLKQRLRDYVESLTGWMGSPDVSRESTALTLLMRIVKEETSQGSRRSEQAWRTDRSTFYAVVEGLLETTAAEAARAEFVEKYVEEHDDVRFFTMLAIKQFFSAEGTRTATNADNAIDILSRIEGVPESQEQLAGWYGQPPQPESHQLLSISAHRKVAQECWLSIFRSPLTASNRKTILNIMTPQILPWFPNRMEVLADFLTDSFNEGGALSLLALSGIFKLMTERNLDYPDFYTKLYSLLDEDVMHSKHRSRFFRLLDQFMSSSHLPAAMVASFIKRLSRLSLQAPPGAVVWAVPSVYNMLKRHPACTFMLHRPYHPAHAIYTSHPDYADSGMDDPFSMSEPDPMTTNAIDSSLWELHTLQDHWHPNVATLAKIIGEQFTKRDYALEDFLDHGYATLVDAELGKEMKRKVEVEWEIPRRIVTAEVEMGGLNALGTLLSKAMEINQEQ
ncbi:Maturation and nuclear export of 40S ribosomal subunits interacting protein [Extremus antarcticus]|uniref:Maturation and nuclear export of 40S ribosomal subunits interacting protein n=1 Tax=Extremus antarcticus TaxID=702011 RepID=A0AAJ0DGI7_9PEZI|nr:Maturation and nuclear export of 40S ribosomal subunits interacting protein [Extremus antarcticus]